VFSRQNRKALFGGIRLKFVKITFKIKLYFLRKLENRTK
jgi:hypothetical protein